MSGHCSEEAEKSEIKIREIHIKISEKYILSELFSLQAMAGVVEANVSSEVSAAAVKKLGI